MAAPYRIRRADFSDIERVATIEAQSFAAPWCREDLLAVLDAGSLVADVQGVVVGFVIARIVPPEAEVLNLAVDPARRRQGIGRALLVAFSRVAVDNGCTHLYLEVRASNTSARALYRRAGWREVSRRSAYYTDPVEDALVLKADLERL